MSDLAIQRIEDEMRAESLMPAPDDDRIYELQAERDALLRVADAAAPGAE